jgi:acylphosphatase
MDGKIRGHLLVAGKVQGVFFREGAKKIAGKYGVFGWVKNLDDGRVELILEGEKESVEKMIQWAKRGPFLARVKEVNFNQEEFAGEYFSFDIK